MKFVCVCFLILSSLAASAQRLQIKERSKKAVTGSEFAKSINDSLLTIDKRELMILEEVHAGNIPGFYRKLVLITDKGIVRGRQHEISYYVLPDFLAIGSDDDYFYIPVRPALAQRIADLLGCSLPTRKMSDRIYKQANLKMIPEPIPPGKAMITVPMFVKHSLLVTEQRRKSLSGQPLGSLVAGNKKDIVISNKIGTPDGKSHVVIYGWHTQNGKPIQPLYNGHDADWVDYSHGVRLIQNKIWIDGKRKSLRRALKSTDFHVLLSDEGAIKNAYYPKH